MKLLGSLALLWSTVVLLGGFVTLLKRIDFGYLTFIGFIQAAGLFNLILDDIKSVVKNIVSVLDRTPKRSSFGDRLLSLLKGTLFSICLVPMLTAMVLATYGPIVCFLLSLTRLLKRDYGTDDGDVSKANMTLALNIFYSLSLAQGALFILCFPTVAYETDMVWAVIRRYGFSYEVIDGYFAETKLECERNLSSTETWNLYTYATRLLDSELPEKYFLGARVLNMLIEHEIPFKRLLIRSPRHRIEKLIRALNWTSPADREVRGLAARIVAHLSADLDLSQFSGALECILPFLDTICHNRSDQEALHFPSERNYQKPPTGLVQLLVQWLVMLYIRAQKNGLMQDTKQQQVEGKPNSVKGTNEDLLFQGLRILENLAHNEHNCSLIYSTKDLLSTITGPVSSDKLISDGKIDVAWIKVLDASLRVLGRLMEAPGDSDRLSAFEHDPQQRAAAAGPAAAAAAEAQPIGHTGEDRRFQIVNSKAVDNLEAVLGLKCDSGILEVQTKSIEIFAQLFSGFESAHKFDHKRENFINRALQIFITDEWMKDYFKDKNTKIDEEIMSQPPKDGEGPSFWEGTFQMEKYNERRRKKLQDKMISDANETAWTHKNMAGKALSMLSMGNQSSSKVIKDSKEQGNVILRLAEMLGSGSKTIQYSRSAADVLVTEIKAKMEWRIHAAEILKHLCAHSEVADNDKKTLLEKVLNEMLNGKTEHEAVASSSRNTSTATINDADSLPSPEERMLQAALLSLYAEIRATWTNAGDFASVVKDFAREGFVGKLKAVVEDNSYATPACLSILKIASEMVKLLIQHNHYINEIKKEKIIDALSEASEAMSGLESCLLFTGVVNDCHGVPVLPLSSALAEQARVLLAKAPESANAAPVGGPEGQNACR